MATKRCRGRFAKDFMLTQVVGQLHVGTPDEDVLPYVRSRFSSGAWERLSAADRRSLSCAALQAHHKNQQLYRAVMRGGR